MTGPFYEALGGDWKCCKENLGDAECLTRGFGEIKNAVKGPAHRYDAIVENYINTCISSGFGYLYEALWAD